MIGTITPLVQEARERNGRFGVATLSVAYVVASVAGGAVLAAVLALGRWALGALAPRLWDDALLAPLSLAVVGVYVLAAFAGTRVPLPMRDEQVPAVWRHTMGPRRALFAYAFLLGTGVTTRINSPAFYLVPIASLTAPTLALAIAIPLTFAFARGLIVVVGALALEEDQDDPDADIAWGIRHRSLTTALQAGVVAATTAGAAVLLLG